MVNRLNGSINFVVNHKIMTYAISSVIFFFFLYTVLRTQTKQEYKKRDKSVSFLRTTL